MAFTTAFSLFSAPMKGQLRGQMAAVKSVEVQNSYFRKTGVKFQTCNYRLQANRLSLNF